MLVAMLHSLKKKSCTMLILLSNNFCLYFVAYLQGPAGIIHMEETSAVWFPYTTIERLWSKLGELIKSGHNTSQCEEQKSLLKAALRKYFQQVNF